MQARETRSSGRASMVRAANHKRSISCWSRRDCPPSPATQHIHSTILADFNSDGKADILLTCDKVNVDDPQSIEIWTVTPVNKSYTLAGRWRQLPPGTGQITVTDFDGDGNVGFGVPEFCNPPGSCNKDSSLHVMLGQPRLPDRKTLLSNTEQPCKWRDDLFDTVEPVTFHSDHLVFPCMNCWPRPRGTFFDP